MSQSKVIVAGAGIIGASIAYHLASSGAAVTIVDKGEPAQGATANSFAWINASRGKTPFHYYLLNRLGMQAWRELDQRLAGKLQVRWGGSVEWQPDVVRAQEIAAASRQHQLWGYPIETVNAKALRKLEPHIEDGGVAEALYTPVEGHVDPVHATMVLLAAAQAEGATLLTHCEIEQIREPAGSPITVHTNQGELIADTLVIAAGNGTAQLAASAGINIPLQRSPGVLVHTKPTTATIQRVVLSPHGHIKQKPDGRMVMGASFKGSEGTDTSMETGHTFLKHVANSLPMLHQTEIEKITLGWRVLPEDGLPIIGFAQQAPHIYIAAMHSGITLGPLVGQLATAEILSGADATLLRPYRPERFQ